MKKKIYALLCGLYIVFNLTACGDKVVIVDEKGTIIQECDLYGRFIEIEEIEYRDEFGNLHCQSICYDKDTKIMYIIDNRCGLSPFYVMNTENEPVIGVYTEAMEIIE